MCVYICVSTCGGLFYVACIARYVWICVCMSDVGVGVGGCGCGCGCAGVCVWVCIFY